LISSQQEKYGIHGSPFRGEKVKKLEEIATSSSLVAKNPQGDRMFQYLNKTVPTHPMRPRGLPTMLLVPQEEGAT